MSNPERIKYLKVDRGRYYYQRRVPMRLHDILELKMWRIPCGKVSFAKAVQMTVNWAEEHDELIQNCASPDFYQSLITQSRREHWKRVSVFTSGRGLERVYPSDSSNNPEYLTIRELPKPWKAAEAMLTGLDIECVRRYINV